MGGYIVLLYSRYCRRNPFSPDNLHEIAEGCSYFPLFLYRNETISGNRSWPTGRHEAGRRLQTLWFRDQMRQHLKKNPSFLGLSGVSRSSEPTWYWSCCFFLKIGPRSSPRLHEARHIVLDEDMVRGKRSKQRENTEKVAYSERWVGTITWESSKQQTTVNSKC